jgi:hypothetical protein
MREAPIPYSNLSRLYSANRSRNDNAALHAHCRHPATLMIIINPPPPWISTLLFVVW